jgi:hypothetical protein
MADHEAEASGIRGSPDIAGAPRRAPRSFSFLKKKI